MNCCCCCCSGEPPGSVLHHLGPRVLSAPLFTSQLIPIREEAAAAWTLFASPSRRRRTRSQSGAAETGCLAPERRRRRRGERSVSICFELTGRLEEGVNGLIIRAAAAAEMINKRAGKQAKFVFSFPKFHTDFRDRFTELVLTLRPPACF